MRYQETMAKLMVREWANFYLDYSRLKDIMETAINATKLLRQFAEASKDEKSPTHKFLAVTAPTPAFAITIAKIECADTRGDICVYDLVELPVPVSESTTSPQLSPEIPDEHVPFGSPAPGEVEMRTKLVKRRSKLTALSSPEVVMVKSEDTSPVVGPSASVRASPASPKGKKTKTPTVFVASMGNDSEVWPDRVGQSFFESDGDDHLHPGEDDASEEVEDEHPYEENALTMELTVAPLEQRQSVFRLLPDLDESVARSNRGTTIVDGAAADAAAMPVALESLESRTINAELEIVVKSCAR